MMVFSLFCLICAVLLSRNIFLQTIERQDKYLFSTKELLRMLPVESELSYAPSNEKTDAVMEHAARILNKTIEKAASQTDLLRNLYDRAMEKRANMKSSSVLHTKPLIWIIFRNKPEDKIWIFSIRSTELSKGVKLDNEYYMSSGFIAVQLAVSRAIISYANKTNVQYDIHLSSMPVSPLMYQEKVRTATSWILLFITFAILPTIIDTQALVVRETTNKFKRAMRMYGVANHTMYIGWVAYGAMSGFPVCIASIVTLLFIFRWIEIASTALFVCLYFCVLLFGALIVAMFMDKVWVSSVWNTLAIVLLTMLAIILVHYNYDDKHPLLVFTFHVFIPPLGFVHGINRFALIESGGGFALRGSQALLSILLSWVAMIIIYWLILMLMQRTLKTSIGGGKTLKSIFFPKFDKYDDLDGIELYPEISRTILENVQELKAIAVSIRYLSKSIKGVQVVKDITMNMYRGEYTMLVSDVTQIQLLQTFVDLITGLTYPEKGTIHILGEEVKRKGNVLTCMPYMLGICLEPTALIDEMTVEEHLIFFFEIALWNQNSANREEYATKRRIHLMTECVLTGVKEVKVKYLGDYYKAQLCWAIATLLEPRVLLVHYIHALRVYSAEFLAVIQDKIRKYRGHRTIIQTTYEIRKMEFADRCFIFDEKKIVFGGSPVNMFQVYGKFYTLMVILHRIRDHSLLASLVSNHVLGTRMRARLGRVILFDVPIGATGDIARLLTTLEEEKYRLDIKTLELSVPDVEEIYKRAIVRFRLGKVHHKKLQDMQHAAIERIKEPIKWRRRVGHFVNMAQLRIVGRKIFKFYARHKTSFIIPLFTSVMCGALIGNALNNTLKKTLIEEELLKDNGMISVKLNLMTVEASNSPTTLIVRRDHSDAGIRIARAYTVSEPYVSDDVVDLLKYYQVPVKKNLRDFLTLQAIDDPKKYLVEYAYGINVRERQDKGLDVTALYGPLHQDQAAAVRTLARAHMALFRHYTNDGDVSIHIINEPLAFDTTPAHDIADNAPILTLFFLILTISHTTLIPSHEYGLTRHVQTTAANSSPLRYWLAMFLWDLIYYAVLVLIMTAAMTIYLVALSPPGSFYYYELMIVPFMLMIYGIGCIPQSYLFGRWPLRELNAMVFIFVNIVFGETTVLVKLLNEDMLEFASLLVHFSPQSNIAYALIQIHNIFHDNNECVIFRNHYTCTLRTFHPCCPDSCGVFRECFKRKPYLVFKTADSYGLLTEVCYLLIMACLFSVTLCMFEYKCVARAWEYLISEIIYPSHIKFLPTKDTVVAEYYKVKREWDEFDSKNNSDRTSPRALLLVHELEKEDCGLTTASNVNFTLDPGASLALVGDERHGRSRICEVLAGLECPTTGTAVMMHKWSLQNDPLQFYARVGFSCEHANSSPDWLTVHEAIMLMGLLRGVPKTYIKAEVTNLIDAFELTDKANTLIEVLGPLQRARLNLAIALIGYPDLIILDEPTIYQDFSVCRALYNILESLRSKGHSVLVGTCCINTSIPLAQRVAIISNGHIKEIDNFHNLLARYSGGYTVVVKLTENFEVETIFRKHFNNVLLNDKIDLYANLQILDEPLSWVEIFKKMENMKSKYERIESYIVSRITLEYIYSKMVKSDLNNPLQRVPPCWETLRKEYKYSKKILATEEQLEELMPLPQTYCIKTISTMPWTVLLER